MIIKIKFYNPWNGMTPYREMCFKKLLTAFDAVEEEVATAMSLKGDYCDYDAKDIDHFVVRIETERFNTFDYSFDEILERDSYSENFFGNELIEEIEDYIKALENFVEGLI